MYALLNCGRNVMATIWSASFESQAFSGTDYYEIRTKGRTHKNPLAKNTESICRFKVLTGEVTVGSTRKWHRMPVPRKKGRVWKRKEGIRSLFFLHFPEPKASIMPKPHSKTQRTSKGSLFTRAEGQTDGCVAPFDPDGDSCCRMNAVDHRVPSHAELTATPTQTNTIPLEIGGWLCQTYGVHGHRWKLKNLLTQSRDWIGQPVCWNVNSDEYQLSPKNHLAVESFSYFKITW